MIFADASALYALFKSDDARHGDARRAETAVRAQREQLWTIDTVLGELWFLLRRNFSLGVCDGILDGLIRRGVHIEALQPEDYERVWEIGREWRDQEFSLTDRQAFAALERTGRVRAWSYDDDFAVIRLGPARNRALQLVR